MSGQTKRAYQAELREQKVIFYKRKILELIDQVKANPFFGYSDALEKLHKTHPEDRAAILQAEREAYKDAGDAGKKRAGQ